MAQPIRGNLDEFGRLLKFVENDFFQTSMTFAILRTIAGPIKPLVPLCNTESESLVLRNSLLITTVIGLGRLYDTIKNTASLRTLMDFFNHPGFLSGLQNRYIDLPRVRRPDLFAQEESETTSRVIREFDKRISDLKTEWSRTRTLPAVKAIAELRHKRYAHSVLIEGAKKRHKIPGLTFPDIEEAIESTNSLIVAMGIPFYGIGTVTTRLFSAPMDLVNTPNVWWEYEPD
jgi:AbiU2